MRDFNDERDEEDQEDALAFGKGQKSAVLETDDDDNVIHSDDANYEAADLSLDDGEESDGSFALFESESDDDLSLQF